MGFVIDLPGCRCFLLWIEQLLSLPVSVGAQQFGHQRRFAQRPLSEAEEVGLRDGIKNLLSHNVSGRRSLLLCLPVSEGW